MPSSRRFVKDRLDTYYHEVSAIILSRQNPATGLIPASVAVTTHGDYRDAWIRDNVYSIMAAWGLALAYRRIDDDEGRAYELEHATIKCMRGILFAYMRQAHKVELFKNSQSVEHALHAKFNTATGDTVVGDREWGHLQIDATSLFLLSLAQMTAAGTLVIYTMDEVHFIQNLVFYIERAYRTPDYGIWERGNKMNHGTPELNSSSIGMVVAALQAINGLNLFGARGGPSSVIHVLPDEITRNYTTLHSALPRESNSKEVDAAVLAVISFPAFAVSDSKLITRTRNEIVKKLGGLHGFKRFLRDGHQTLLEDTTRLHYDPHELKIFEGIECEWPLFYTYMILDGLFREDGKQVQEYRDLLEPLLVESSTVTKFRQPEEYVDPHVASKIRNSQGGRASVSGRRSSVVRAPLNRPPTGTKLVPELYIVPRDKIAEEKSNHGSVKRIANENIPLVWAQSLYILGQLIQEDLLSPAELDPLGRRLLPFRPKQGSEVVVQIVLLAESPELQAKLASFGLETQTLDTCAPVTISPPSALRDAYLSLGENTKLGLSGRPKRPIGTLSTSKLYRCQGRMYAFLPHFMDKEEFYLVSDNNYLVSVLEQELAFVKNHWWYPGRPTLCVMLTREMLGGLKSSKDPSETQRWRYNHRDSKRNLLNFMMSLRSGMCGGVRVRVGRLSEMINSSCIESLDFLVSSVGETEDWHSVLKGEWHQPEIRKLQTETPNGAPTPTNEKPKPVRGRSLRRKSSGDMSSFISQSITKSPLKSPYYTEDPLSYEENFKLKEHIELLDKLELGPSVANKMNRDDASPMRGVSSNRAAARGGLGVLSGSNDVLEKSSHDGTRRSSYTFDINDMANLKSVMKKTSSQGLNDSNGQSNAQSPLAKISNGTTGWSKTNTPEDSKLGSQNGIPHEVLTLTLNDPTHIEAATELLDASSNIYDQIDLLHYLYSCCGLDYRVSHLGTIKSLLEEVYVKAMQMKEWSIVRQVAGLLKKMVNSLTINVADLLIRGKPVAIGFGNNEFFITNPLSPEALSELIYRHCASDVREAPLVQEILTYLGSMIRSQASMFDGIQRVRTYFFIIAMREEISRLKGCDEEEAVEFMMQLSPYEMKMLLNTVLSARDQTNTSADASIGLSTSYRWRNMQGQDAELDSKNVVKMATSGVALPSQIVISAQSAGFSAGNFAKISLARDSSSTPLPAIFGRGLNVAVIDPLDGAIIESASFDTHISAEESYELTKMIEWVDPGCIVIVVAKDDCTENLTPAAKIALESLGSAKIRDVGYRDSWCLIGEKGAEPGSMPEAHSPAKVGPTATISRTIDLVSRRKKVLASYPSNSQMKGLSSGAAANMMMPSNGRWLRRRKNDGALNRVPPEFYPKVWKVLSKCHGIIIGREFLPRDPTISEKTPEELNFALQVESYLDVIRDPAERQIAVECLMVVSRIADRNPEIQINAGPLDLMKIIRDAVSQFWIRWVGDQSALLSSSDLSFEKNERFARRLFFDLAQEGNEGTMAYLAKSSVRISFDVSWLGENSNVHDEEADDSLGANLKSRS
ncbi:phosphorylase kinase alphabeta [Rhizoclosmatium globosum]|uniref:Phosphorylase kinase alphabeta n=1 Tax=Rhizoclosmatium globosum TaxID=329046 RepID=A0A1Y2CWJ9_9FUNG|nr:phosphorylase kinase alphabeta [Rhizoclosmatium globosum]|eukprot:ORY50715.1 phosphorylase kinase alphabeta [Rhizoclosmatium globosum]